MRGKKMTRHLGMTTNKTLHHHQKYRHTYMCVCVCAWQEYVGKLFQKNAQVFWINKRTIRKGIAILKPEYT